jgi:hypothetical protein
MTVSVVARGNRNSVFGLTWRVNDVRGVRFVQGPDSLVSFVLPLDSSFTPHECHECACATAHLAGFMVSAPKMSVVLRLRDCTVFDGPRQLLYLIYGDHSPFL